MNKPERDRRRANAAGHVAAGGALLGGAAAANYVNDRALERRGLDKPVKTAVKRGKLRPAHAGYAAAKVGVRSLQVTGIPMAAYGAYNLVKPDKNVPRVSPKKDVAKPLARAATFQDAADEYRRRIGKADLSVGEQKRLVRHKKVGRDLSIAGGLMGLGALSLRSPEIARVAASRSRRLANTRAVRRLAAKEPSATKASNTLGIAAIGSGSIGSFNYAGQQKLEAKQIRKALFRAGHIKGLGKVRVISAKDDYFDVLDSRDARRLVHRSRITPLPASPKPRRKQAPPKPGPEQGTLFGKRDDQFLRDYKDRISPRAEAGYNSMRRQRNKDRAWAAGQAGLTGVNALGLAGALKARSKVWTPLAAGATAFSAHQSVKHARKARRYDMGPMEGIRRKARDRAARGVYGQDRGKDPVDKALVPRLPVPRSVPKGLLRKPTMRRSYVARRPSGKLVSVRGGFG